MKHLFTVCLAGIMGCLSVNASLEKTCIRIFHQSDCSYFPLEEVRELEFKKTGISVNTIQGEIPFTYGDILKIDFSDDTDLKVEEAPLSHMGLSFQNEEVMSASGATISIYDSMGRLIATLPGKGSVRELPAGIYVAICNGETLKFLKR